MADVPRDGREDSIQTRSCEDGSRDWSCVKNAWSHQKLEETKEHSASLTGAPGKYTHLLQREVLRGTVSQVGSENKHWHGVKRWGAYEVGVSKIKPGEA